MTTAARKHRGIASQVHAAAWFRDHGFPYATDAGSGRNGRPTHVTADVSYTHGTGR